MLISQKHTGIEKNCSRLKTQKVRILGGVLEGNKAFWGIKQIRIQVRNTRVINENILY